MIENEAITVPTKDEPKRPARINWMLGITYSKMTITRIAYLALGIELLSLAAKKSFVKRK